MTGPAARFAAFVRHFLVAMQFATRLPMRSAAAEIGSVTAELGRSSVVHLPGAGMLIGLAACLAFALASLLLPPGVFSPLAAAVVATGVTAALTGATGEQALAGASARLLGDPDLPGERDATLLPLGIVVLTLAIVLKLALLALLAGARPAAVMAALLAAHTTSRFAPLVLVHTLRYVPGPLPLMGDVLASRISRPALVLAALWCVAPLALLWMAAGAKACLLALAFAAIGLWLLRRRLEHRYGGFTGESLGAAQQVCEAAIYFGTAIGLGR